MRALIVTAALALLAAPALAGCLNPAGLKPSNVPADGAMILPYLDTSDAHHHENLEQHRAGWNVDVAGWSPGTTDLAKLGHYNQVQVKDGYAFVSVYNAPPSMKPGLMIYDVRDPAAPKVVSTWASDDITPIDVHLSEDGKFLALGGHRQTLPAAPVAPPALPVDNCVGLPTPTPPSTVCQPFVPGGIQLLDVSDKAHPKLLATYHSIPSGAHTVKLATIGGALYAFIASYGFSYADRLASGVEIARYDPGGPLGGQLTLVSRFVASQSSGGGVFVHDMYVQKHPATSKWLLWVAYWDGGVVIANVDDPANPVEIAQWKDFDAATYGNIHFVKPMDALIAGKHVTVATPEFGASKNSGESYVLDTTDPAKPKLLGKWHLPGDPANPGGYMHSPHNFDLTKDGLMVFGHYHAGVWVLDLNPVISGNATEPTVLGYRFTVPPVGAAVKLPNGSLAPDVWNAVWAGSDWIVASDISTGLYTMKLGTRAPGTPPYAALV